MYYDTYEPGMLREVIDRSIESQEAYTIFKMSDDAVYQEVVDEMHKTLMEEGAGYLGELYGLWQVSYSYSEEGFMNKKIVGRTICPLSFYLQRRFQIISRNVCRKLFTKQFIFFAF